MISAIRQFYNDMRACVKLNDGVCSGWFAVEQGLRQGCVLASLLFNIFFTAVINVAYTRLKADIKVSWTLWCTQGRKGGRGGATAGKPALATPLWDMLNADDAGVVSQPPEQLREDDGRDHGRVRGVWPSRIGGQRLRSCVYARRGCRKPPLYLA